MSTDGPWGKPPSVGCFAGFDRPCPVGDSPIAGRNCLVLERGGGFSRSILPGFTETENFSSHVSIQTGIAGLCSGKTLAGNMLYQSGLMRALGSWPLGSEVLGGGIRVVGVPVRQAQGMPPNPARWANRFCGEQGMGLLPQRSIWHVDADRADPVVAGSCPRAFLIGIDQQERRRPVIETPFHSGDQAQGILAVVKDRSTERISSEDAPLFKYAVAPASNIALAMTESSCIDRPTMRV
jgi:hypothetical protein